MVLLKFEYKYRATSLTDEELAELYVSTNDELLFEEIVNRYSNCIYATAFRITRNHHDSEEILQEVLLLLAKKIDTFRSDAKFSTWLYRVTLNTCYGRLRSESKRFKDISLEDYAPYDRYGSLGGKVKSKEWSNNPYLILYRKEALEMIEKAIADLPEKYRIVLLLRDIEQLPQDEISSILGISIGAVKSRLHRARLFVRDKISDYFQEWRK
jgi:RNA polymerase sigma-70 factor (ECF subfamily)